MSNSNPEKSILLASIVNDFLLNRDPEDYLKLMDDLLLIYVTTDEFVHLPPDQRIDAVCSIKEIKGLIAGLIKHKYSNYDSTAKEELEEKTKKLLTI
jgi:hypothetical protein